MVDSRIDEHNQSPRRDSTRVSSQIPSQLYNPFGDTGFSLLERRETYTPSTVSASSSSPSTPNSRSSTYDQSHVRTSSGKSQRHLPPRPSYSPTRPTPPPKPRREAGWNDDEMPFDQLGLSRPVPHCSPPRYPSPNKQRRQPPPPLHRPFDEPSAFADAPEDELVIVGGDSSPDRGFSDTGGGGRRNVQVLRAYYSDNDRFRSASPPTILTEDEPNHNYEEFGLSPGSATDSSPRKLRKKLGLARSVTPVANTAGDDDSLFNFEAADERKRMILADIASEAANSKGNKPRRFRRNRRSEDDNSSQEGDDDLQKRTQQAYQRRNRNQQKGTTQKSSKAVGPKLSNIVCFDTYDETIFQMADDNKEVGDVIESAEIETVASEYSLNSDYTKSMESEVEDLFKDLLFIGNPKSSKPGRRSYRYKQNKKFDMESCASETLGTLEEDWTVDASQANGTSYTTNGENVSDTSRGSSASREEKAGVTVEKAGVTVEKTEVTVEKTEVTVEKTEVTVEKTEVKVEKSEAQSPTGVVPAEGDPFVAIWEFLEGGVNLVTETLGLPPPDCSSPDTNDVVQDEDQHVDRNLDQNLDQEVKTEIGAEHALFAHPGCNAFVTSKPAVAAAVEVKDVEVDNLSPLDATMSYAAEWLLGAGSVDQQSKVETKVPEFEEVAMYSLERDPSLADMAFYAAQSMYKLQGLEFDESCRDASLVDQVVFKVIKIGLPLGVLFQENDGGCWVANVFATGNAAKLSPDDAILIGDQLAAVDGRSALGMNVDDICSLVSEAENTQSIELTFLRYVGPVNNELGKEEGDIATPDDDVEPVSAESPTPSAPVNDKQPSLPLEEHVFDTMHKMLTISRNEEKKIANKKGKKNAPPQVGKTVFKWFGRSTKV
ncbi:hypothetical protein MHU86_18950 [Fragilaria crotonensis]|nr:hypothetical protein MHU86_18950 [Fragilaria crotonensis]